MWKFPFRVLASAAVVALLVSLLMSTANADSSNGSTGTNDGAIKLLTEELKQLRIVLNRSLSANTKARFLFDKFKVQSDSVFQLRQIHEKLLNDIEEKTEEINKDAERIKNLDQKKPEFSSEPQPEKNSLVEIIEDEKLALERLKKRESEYRHERLQAEAILNKLSEDLLALEQDTLKTN